MVGYLGMAFLVGELNVGDGIFGTGGMHKTDNASAEPTPAKPGADHSVCGADDLLQVMDGLAAALVMLDRASAGVKHQPAEVIQSAFLPRSLTFLNTLDFAEKMMGPPE